MFKTFLFSTVTLLCSGAAFAAPITADNLVGVYRVDGRVGFTRVMAKFNVINNREFELQRLHVDGTKDEVCNGVFTLGALFQGRGSCPSDRSKDYTFNINFNGQGTQDLVRGAIVTITSSMAPGRSLDVQMKRQSANFEDQLGDEVFINPAW